MNLRRIDLNLFLVFDALMRERNVTAAARAIGLSQSAFSNALARLRERLDDELFIRSPNGMRPTDRALELAAPIASALADIEQAIEGNDFDPLLSSRRIKIAAIDYGTLLFVPRLLRYLETKAPAIELNVIASGGDAAELLDKQEADLVIASWPKPPARFSREPLFEDEWVCVMRAEHPLAMRKLTLKTYAKARHLLVSPSGDTHGWVDDVLASQGRSRQVVATLPSFAAAPFSIEGTDLILTCPRRVGEDFKSRFGLTMVKCPVESPSTLRSIDMVWHTRLGNHTALQWLRNVLWEIANNVAE